MAQIVPYFHFIVSDQRLIFSNLVKEAFEIVMCLIKVDLVKIRWVAVTNYNMKMCEGVARHGVRMTVA